MKLKKLGLVAFVSYAISILVVSSGFAATYYVKNNGNDKASGLSDANAWATIAKVNDFAEQTRFSNGDVIQFKRGDTWGDDETLGNDGSSISWGTINGLTFQDYGTGDKPRFNGNTQQPILISSNSITNLTIKNIDVSGSDTTGDRCKISKVNGVTIDGVDYDGHTGASSYKRSSAIGLFQCRGDLTVKNCTIRNTIKATFADSLAAWYKGDAAGIIIWYLVDGAPKTSGTVTVNNNTVSNIYSDCLILGGIQTASNVYDNTFSNFGENAIDIKKTRYVDIYYNDMSHNDFGWAGGAGSKGPTTITTGSGTKYWPGYSSGDVVIRDNYFHSCKYQHIVVACNNTKVYRNYIKDGGLSVKVTGHDNAEIHNNIFEITEPGYTGYGNIERSGIRVDQINNDNTLIYNNTFYITSTNHLYAIAIQSHRSCTGTTIKNNVMYMTRNSAGVFPLYVQDYDGSNTYPTIEYNCYYNANHTNRVGWDGTIYDSTEQVAWRNTGHTRGLFADPLFTNPQTGDFTLSQDSPCILPDRTLGVSKLPLSVPGVNLLPPGNLRLIQVD